MSRLREAVRSSLWAQTLAPQELERVEGELVERAVPAGAYACRKGEPVNHWIEVIEGLLKLGTVSPEGKAATLTGVPAGGWFGEGSLLRSEPRAAMMQSRCATAMLEYERLLDPEARVARSACRCRRRRSAISRGFAVAREPGAAGAGNRRPAPRRVRRRHHSRSRRAAHKMKVKGKEHWTRKGDVKLFLWQKAPQDPSRGTILFVHGSSMASQPTFDLEVRGRPHSSVMEWFAERGFDTWCLDNEGYGRSDKSRPINCDIANGAEDIAAAAEYIGKTLLIYGISSGALKAALFAQRHPERVARLALDAFVWTGEGSPTLAERRRRLPEFQSKHRRPIDRAFVRSIFSRDHPGTADEATVEAFATAILALDDSVPTGTYVDMCSKLPLVDPAKITMPTIVMRGEYDGIAGIDDLLAFFRRLPHPDKQFTVMAGISHASFQQKNYLGVYHILHSFFTQPQPVYRA